MKNNYSKAFGIILFMLFQIINSFGSSKPNMHIQLDKSSYVSGEKIRFKNTISNYEKNHNTILFVDFCGENYLLSSAIVQRTNCHWQGEIIIPDSVQTGVYVFRAYTGDENGNATVVSQLVPVFNRFGNNANNEEKKKRNKNIPFNELHIPNNNSEKLSLTATKNNFRTNETATFNIFNTETDFIGGISLTVFKIDTMLFTNNSPLEIESPFQISENIKIYNGLTIRGKATLKDSGKAAANEMILFSIPDTIPQLNYSQTNDSGLFQFYIEDYYGEQTAYVQTLNKTEAFNIELFPIFLLPPSEIPFYIPIELEESEFVKLSIKRAMYAKAYQKDFAEEKQVIKTFKYPFYGETNHVVIPSDYIDLIDFNEISKEILPLVKYKSTNSETSLKIYDPNYKLYLNAPWAIVDGVPISDLSSLNKLNTQAITKIEMQPTIRCYGNVLIEGALSVFTKKGNYFDFPLPKNSVKTTFETYYHQKTDLTNNSNLNFRDLLYWDPFLEFNNNKTINIKCSLETGSYIAIAQGIDKNGKKHYSTLHFTVNE